MTPSTSAVDPLSPLARAELPRESARFAPELVLWEDSLPGGAHGSLRLRRGTTLRLVDIEGRANVSALLFNADEPGERYNMPDTLKAQHTAFLTRGNACYSDMGRILCSIPADTCGWHDTVGGVSDAASLAARYGEARYQTHRNAMHRNGRDGLLTELGKWGLGKRDLVPNLNFFSKLAADARGALHFETAHRVPGQFVELRCEMNVLLLYSAAPHPFDPAPAYAPGSVGLVAWRSGTAGADDPCRLSRPENARGFANTERGFL